MAGEVANIAEIANKVSVDIFKWFKWEKIPIMDENFSCHKANEHKKKTRSKVSDKHTHPVDVVFKYFDPYLNKIILLNTDLKSYAKKSLTHTSVKSALVSLGKTIDCARSSEEWQKKYVLDDASFDIRGMLFIYNHDNEYDNNFFEHFKKIKTENLSIKKNQVIHVLEPSRIRYLSTVVADMMKLHAHGEIPRDEYTFFSPDMILHKSHGDADNYPATVEMLCSPYLILKHDKFKVYDTAGKELSENQEGYVIYYNQDGSTDYEFMYLFDYLSRFQILSSKAKIKIRVAHNNPHKNIRSNFQSAINSYIRAWSFDEYKKRDLTRIDFDIVSLTVPQYMPGCLAWRVD